MHEQWKIISSFKDYEVSNLGNVRSKDRVNYYGRQLKGRKLKQCLTTCGYPFVILRKNGESYNRMIHRLVAEAFLSNENECINHKDGNKENNNLSNLEWVSYSTNRQHSNNLGLSPQRGIPKNAYVVSSNGTTYTFETMMAVNRIFGFKKGWINNHLKKSGNPFIYASCKIGVIE